MLLSERPMVAVEPNNQEPKKKGRVYTLSIAVPSSILSKVQSKELKTYVCGQIARSACLYSVDEIIVYNEEAIANQ
jgi:predicted SPOUT superfamily RNA methylase MTH1